MRQLWAILMENKYALGLVVCGLVVLVGGFLLPRDELYRAQGLTPGPVEMQFTLSSLDQVIVYSADADATCTSSRSWTGDLVPAFFIGPRELNGQTLYPLGAESGERGRSDYTIVCTSDAPVYVEHARIITPTNRQLAQVLAACVLLLGSALMVNALRELPFRLREAQMAKWRQEAQIEKRRAQGGDDR